MRFLDQKETASLKFAIGQSEGPSIEERRKPHLIERQFLTSGMSFLMHDRGDESVCLAWVLGDEGSFIAHYVHEEIHHSLHKLVGMETYCAYDKVARHVEEEPHEPHRVPVPTRSVKISYFLPYGFRVRFSDDR